MQQLMTFVANNPFMSGLWIVLLLALIIMTIRSTMQGIKQLQAQQAIIWTNRENGIFVDIRSADEYRKGHVSGAKSLPQQQIKDNKVHAIEKFKDAPIVLVCNTGHTAISVAKSLQEQGFNQVAVLAGGMNAWRNDKLPIATGK